MVVVQGSSAAVKHLLTLKNYSPTTIRGLLSNSHNLKHRVKNGIEYQPLIGQSMAMFFKKRSTRTRISSESGFSYLGGQALFLGKDDIQLGVNESVRDTAEVVSRLTNILLARVNHHSEVTELAKYSKVPVINALCDKYHPLQALADLMTLQEHYPNFPYNNNGNRLKIAWVGDGNNIIHSLLMSAPKLNVDVHVATPVGYECLSDVVQDAQGFAKESGSNLRFTSDAKVAVNGCDVVITDTWISMGEENQRDQKLKTFTGYQVTKELMGQAASDAIFMHCLPRHEEEVSDDVFYSKKSLVWQEAENRKYTVMAAILYLLDIKV